MTGVAGLGVTFEGSFLQNGRGSLSSSLVSYRSWMSNRDSKDFAY